MKETMRNFILAQYPHAVLTHYITGNFGAEQQFLLTPDSEDEYTCVLRGAKLTILTDY